MVAGFIADRLGHAPGARRAELSTAEVMSHPVLGAPLPIALVLGLVAVFIDIWLGGLLTTIDVWLAQWSIGEASALYVPASVLDRIGLRGVTVPVLVLLGLWLRWRSGQWRPLGLAVVSVLAVNVVVGGLKLAVGRGRPSEAVPDLFVGGQMWPSGHAANIALTTALIIYLLRTYGHRPVGQKVAVTTVAIPSIAMTAVSVALGYHWLSDLVAGTIVGLYIATVVTRLDAHQRRTASGAGPQVLIAHDPPSEPSSPTPTPGRPSTALTPNRMVQVS